MKRKKSTNNIRNSLKLLVRKGGFIVDLASKTIYFDCNNPRSVDKVQIKRLVKEFNFDLQAELK